MGSIGPSTPTNTTMKRTPVYFVSHGGPTTMYEPDHPVWPHLQSIGHEIVHTVKPRAIVVFSAHWQADRPGTVEINFSESEPLVYDFYGFPKHFYMEKFQNHGSKQVAARVGELVREAGWEVQEVERGLDHGVFVPFKVMFNPEEGNGLGDVPVVQVSLLTDENDASGHVRLGRAVERLREEGVCIVVSGMAVHNLRHLMMLGRGSGRTLEYAVTFDEALKDAVEEKEVESGKREEKVVHLLERKDARLAHPTFEHLIPVHVGVGAAGIDRAKQLWTMPEGSMSWAQFRFGDVEA